MIRIERYNGALAAVQAALIRARAMSCEGASVELTALLDAIEYLPHLIASDEDETERFRAAIADIAARFRCGWALQRFDPGAFDTTAIPEPAGMIGGDTRASDAVEILREYVVGRTGVDDFACRFRLTWRDGQDSGWLAREPIHVQRGLDLVFTAIDSFETDVANGQAALPRESVLHAEVRVVLSILQP